MYHSSHSTSTQCLSLWPDLSTKVEPLFLVAQCLTHDQQRRVKSLVVLIKLLIHKTMVMNHLIWGLSVLNYPTIPPFSPVFPFQTKWFKKKNSITPFLVFNIFSALAYLLKYSGSVSVNCQWVQSWCWVVICVCAHVVAVRCFIH